MKVRHGFVSNSSSTSFCIYGVYFGGGISCDDNGIIQRVASDLGLFTHDGQYEGMFVGREFSDIKDNETGKQFKEDTQTKVQKMVAIVKLKGVEASPGDFKCSVHQEGWYDG